MGGGAEAAGKFYEVVSQASFTLLGLWLVVLGISQVDWNSAERHRERLHIALFFVVPGTMGLIAILAGGNTTIWRVIFILGALVGLAESLPLLVRHRPGARGSTERLLHIVAPVAWFLVLLFALNFSAQIAGLVPLQVEGFAVALVFVLGVVHVWRVFAERPAPTAPR